MKYFLNAAQRKASGSTCYFEFQKGDFKNKYWLNDSLYLDVDSFDSLMLYALFCASIENFCYYAPTKVSPAHWERIVEKSNEKEQWKEIIEELHPWVKKCFTEHSCFTILGI